jgi:cobalt-precorrin-5B (C1)-methyltransferase
MAEKTPSPPLRIRRSEARKGRGARSGFTTGACAAAAARAAAHGLVDGDVPESVLCRLPNGNDVSFAVSDGCVEGAGTGRISHAVVVKDAGDDPDATNGARLTVDIRLIPAAVGDIVLRGGAGVGRVTLEGLGLAVGGPAINPVPQRNIRENVRAVGTSLLERDGLDITVSIPDGEEMAKRTLNARLGILGGISILGTTGIVRPYSTAAFRTSVVQAVSVAARGGGSSVVFTTGGRSERFAMRELPDLGATCFVQMGDFVKAAFTAAIKNGVRRIYVGAMAGKLTKMGQGLAVTHAWRTEIDRGLIAECARAAGALPDLVDAIRAAETARFAAERLQALGLTVEFHRTIAKRALCSLKAKYPGDYHLTVMACDFDGKPIVRVEEEDAA